LFCLLRRLEGGRDRPRETTERRHTARRLEGRPWPVLLVPEARLGPRLQGSPGRDGEWKRLEAGRRQGSVPSRTATTDVYSSCTYRLRSQAEWPSSFDRYLRTRQVHCCGACPCPFVLLQGGARKVTGRRSQGRARGEGACRHPVQTPRRRLSYGGCQSIGTRPPDRRHWNPVPTHPPWFLVQQHARAESFSSTLLSRLPASASTADMAWMGPSKSMRPQHPRVGAYLTPD